MNATANMTPALVALKRTRNFCAATFILLLAVYAFHMFVTERHCQFTPSGDHWRAQRELTTGKDPCALNRPMDIDDISFGLGFAGSGLVFVIAAVMAARAKYRDPSLRSG